MANFSEKVSKMGLSLKGGSTSYKSIAKFTLAKQDRVGIQYNSPYDGACTIDGVVVAFTGDKLGADDVVHVKKCIRPSAGVYNGSLFSLSTCDVKLAIGADSDTLPEWEDFADTDDYTDLKSFQEDAAKQGWPAKDKVFTMNDKGKVIVDAYELKDGKAVLLVAEKAKK